MGSRASNATAAANTIFLGHQLSAGVHLLVQTVAIKNNSSAETSKHIAWVYGARRLISDDSPRVLGTFDRCHHKIATCVPSTHKPT